MLAEPRIARNAEDLGRSVVKREIDRALERARAREQATDTAALVEAICTALDAMRCSRLQPVVNATGVLLHTNLGRAPLAAEAIAAIERTARGYTNLEYDLATGRRGSRYDALVATLSELTGASDALVVNNGAAAVALVLDTFARGREVVVSRGELVEIGGGFRIPDVLERSGARLVEVGTTNRTYSSDFEAATTARTALLLRTHRSNFALEGFVREVAGAELVALGRRIGVRVAEDLGSGALTDLSEYGLSPERTVIEALRDGIDPVTFSCDKLLGGPQAGAIVGSRATIARLRANPLLRTLRSDKLSLAALDATLQLHRTRATRERIPLYRMLAFTLEALEARASAYLAALPGARAIASQARVGAGALPTAVVASHAVLVASEHPDALLAALRREDPPVVGRAAPEGGLFDLRTISPEEDARVIAALMRATRA